MEAEAAPDDAEGGVQGTHPGGAALVDAGLERESGHAGAGVLRGEA